MKTLVSLKFSLLLSLGLATAADTHDSDIVVYGDASGGVVAAVQAMRMASPPSSFPNTVTSVGSPAAASAGPTLETIFMVLSQSAATAGSMAIDDGTSVQKVPYEKLRTHLLADDQRLTK